MLHLDDAALRVGTATAVRAGVTDGRGIAAATGAVASADADADAGAGGRPGVAGAGSGVTSRYVYLVIIESGG